MSARAVGVLGSILACGCILIVGADDRLVDSKPGDAGPEAPCHLDLSFSTPQYEGGLSSDQDEGSLRLSPDGLEAFVSRRVSGDTFQIVRYRRGNVDAGAPWEEVAKEASLSVFVDGGAASVTDITLTPDGLGAIALQSEPLAPRATTLSWTTRPAPGSAWGVPVPVGELEAAQEDYAPFISHDGTTLYFHSNRFAPWRIIASHSDGARWSTPTALPPILDFEDRNPVLSGDERTIYLAANVDTAAPDPRHVFRATRRSSKEVFRAPEEVAELNTSGLPSYPTWLSRDGCTIYIIAKRPARSSFDVYSATKPLR